MVVALVVVVVVVVVSMDGRMAVHRNEKLEAAGYKFPSMRKTGTTIVGVVFKDGVVLGADTRATNDSTVADKNCEKIHYIADNIYCCGAGTAADTEHTTGAVQQSLCCLLAVG